MKKLILLLLLVPLISCNQDIQGISPLEKEVIDNFRKMPGPDIAAQRYLVEFSIAVQKRYGQEKYKLLFNRKKQKIRIRTKPMMNEIIQLKQSRIMKRIPVEPSFAGIAFGMYDDDRIEIYIDEVEWNSLNEKGRKLLIFHELAHDILNAEHTKGKCDLMGTKMSPCMSENLESKMYRLGKKYEKRINELIEKLWG